MTASAAIAAPDAELDKLVSQLHVAMTDLRGAETEARRQQDLVDHHAESAERSREVATRRRIEVGRMLLEIRPRWPERGTGAKPWGEFLARIPLDDATARRYMDEARDPAAYDRKRKAAGDLTAVESVLASIRKLGPAARKQLLAELKPANVSGGSGETDRGSWVTSKRWADAVGPWDLDPFSNPRSHIVAARRCMLEDGGDGLAGHPDEPGAYIEGTGSAPGSRGLADSTSRVWIQPPYGIVEDVIAHYGHTRFCALLRLDSSTGWFSKLWDLTRVIALPKGTREFFEPPPGVEASGNPQPHALYYRDPRDITPAIAETCILLDRYEARPLLEVVR